MEPHRLLLIDSDSALLQALPGTLGLYLPYVQVETCASADHAMERITFTDYDVIICEARAVGLDGLTLLENVRALRPLTPIIIFTGHGDPTLAKQAFEAGAYDFLFKPIDRHILLLSVMRALEVRGLRKTIGSTQREQLTARRGRPQPA